METKLNISPEVMEKARTQSRIVMQLLEKFNEATGTDGSPESFMRQLPLLKELSSALLLLEELNPAATSAAERDNIRKQVQVEDGMSIRTNLQGLMAAFAIVGMSCQNMGQKMRTCVVYFPLIAEYAEMFQDELNKK